MEQPTFVVQHCVQVVIVIGTNPHEPSFKVGLSNVSASLRNNRVLIVRFTLFEFEKN